MDKFARLIRHVCLFRDAPKMPDLSAEASLVLLSEVLPFINSRFTTTCVSHNLANLCDYDSALARVDGLNAPEWIYHSQFNKLEDVTSPVFTFERNWWSFPMTFSYSPNPEVLAASLRSALLEYVRILVNYYDGPFFGIVRTTKTSRLAAPIVSSLINYCQNLGWGGPCIIAKEMYGVCVAKEKLPLHLGGKWCIGDVEGHRAILERTANHPEHTILGIGEGFVFDLDNRPLTVAPFESRVRGIQSDSKTLTLDMEISYPRILEAHRLIHIQEA